jgi:hypothetical protein
LAKLPRSLRLTALTFGALALSAALLVIGCKSGSSGGGAFIDPDAAAAALDKLLPAADALPGGGWEEISRNVPASSDSSGNDFATVAANEPACANLPQLAELGSIFDDKTDLATVATANAEFERTAGGAFFPTSVQMQVDLQKTSAEVADAWKTVKKTLNAPETMACLEAAFNSSLSDDASGTSATVKTATPAATAPQDGTAVAFDLQFSVLGVDVDGTIQIYLWPYGNSAVDILVFGPSEGMTDSEIADMLTLVDSALVSAAEEY